MKKVLIERTKKGFPALWECGGGYTNTGEATIIASPSGGPKKPVYIRRRGPLTNGEHALIPIEVGDYIVEADHHRKDFYISVMKIVEIEEKYASLESFALFNEGEWDNKDIERVFAAWEAGDLKSIDDIDDEIYFLCRAILAAEEKATCYHCREPHYIDE